MDILTYALCKGDGEGGGEGGGGFPVVEMSFDGDTFNSTPVKWHTTTQECSDKLDAIISKEPLALLVVLPSIRIHTKDKPVPMVFTIFGEFLSEYDLQYYPRYVAHYMLPEGYHWHLQLIKGEWEWGEHNKWMLHVKLIQNSAS